MHGVLRLLTIWLLALALPAQGVAAVAMQHCGPGHAQQTLLLDRAAHAGAHAPHAHAQATAADQPSAEAATSPFGKQHCSACATCCSASALAPSLPSLPLVEPAIERVSLVVQACTGPCAAGLERPPRQAQA